VCWSVVFIIDYYLVHEEAFFVESLKTPHAKVTRIILEANTDAYVEN